MQKLTLGEIAEFTNGGAWTGEEYSAAGVAVVRVSDVGRGTVDLTNCKFLSETSAGRYAKHRLKALDVIVCTVGSHPTQPGSVVGRVGIVPSAASDALLNQNAVCLRARPGVDQRWLGYFCQSGEFAKYIQACSRGAANQVRMSISLLGQMAVTTPPLSEQRRIAGTLSAYDDLIENCERRVRVLDEMARALYREWFVLFRYPGHQKTPLVDSALRRIPKGWRQDSLGSVIRVNALQIDQKGPPSRIRYIDISSVSPGSVDTVTEYEYPSAPGRARRVVSHGDVLWSCVRPNRRSHALVLHPDEATIASTGFAVLSPGEVPYSYVYAATTTDDFVSYLEKRATGAAYPAVTAQVFEDAPFLVPDKAVLKQFGQIANPWAETTAVLRRRIENLRRTRHLLLPRLLSGQLSTEDAA